MNMGKNIFKDKRLNSQAGFTLLEVIVAISILTVGLLAVGSMQLSAITANDRAGKMTQGTAIAEEKMEELLSLPYTLASTHAFLSEGSHTETAPPTGYNVSWTVQNNTPANNVKTIAVRVTWYSGLKSTSLTSYLARS
jgi:type IV pilus assembly protein PilV